tara:strand:+ start:266 stop:952 length:687 start_codon:yes stop_codon:yes gene_type:complete
MADAGVLSLDDKSAIGSRLEVVDLEANLPRPENLELAESVLKRLQPKDQHEMGQMIHSRSVMGGILFTVIAIFWWLTVSVIGDKLGDADADLPVSMIFGINFFQASLLIPVCVLVATVLLMHSRERNNWQSGAIGGVLLIVALYFTLEPVGWLIFTDYGQSSLVLQSLRIGALAIMIHFASNMILDSILLTWVERMIQSFPIELTELDEPLLLGSGDFDNDEEDTPSA